LGPSGPADPDHHARGHGRWRQAGLRRDARRSGGARQVAGRPRDASPDEMIEKNLTRILDTGGSMSRQSGRGRLVVVKGPDRGETISINDLAMTVGSGPGNEVLLSDPTISRRHLIIEPGVEGVTLRDLGSTNGSFVQGARFQELTLGFGTEVT